MKLFKVNRTDKIWYDEYIGFVVRAESKEKAFELCVEETKNSDAPFTEFNAEATEINSDGEQEIILESYNAG